MEWFVILCTFIGVLVCMALGTIAIAMLVVKRGDRAESVYTSLVFIVSWFILLLASSCIATWIIVM